MATFPTDVIIEILSRLPVKFLLRSTTVCKSWRSLIKSPIFINLHLKKSLLSNSDHNLMISWNSLHFAEFNSNCSSLSLSSKLKHPLEPSKLHLIGSCDGLVCVCDETRSDVFIINPLTKSLRKLPSIRIPNRYKEVGDAAIVFGFGYDSQNDDYKVFRSLQDGPNKMGFFTLDGEAQVYSLKNDTWKNVERMPYRIFLWNHAGVHVNETIHHVTFVRNIFSEKRLIVGFNLRTETFSSMDLPNYDTSGTNYMFMCELDGCLSLLVNYSRDPVAYAPYGFPHADGADLWVMKEYGKKKSWVKLFSIRDPESIGIFGEINVVYLKDETTILLKIDTGSATRCDSELGWYDLKKKTFEKILVNRGPNSLYEAIFFNGSLVSVVDNKLPPVSQGETMTNVKNKKKRNDFLSVGFKLKL
ncbi:unnamed protein product [Amaranthus hypochondriacus]